MIGYESLLAFTLRLHITSFNAPQANQLISTSRTKIPPVGDVVLLVVQHDSNLCIDIFRGFLSVFLLVLVYRA